MTTKKPQPDYLSANYGSPNVDAADAFIDSLKPPAPPKKPAGVLRTAGDLAIKGAQGVVDLGAGVVGLGSLATGGAVGEGMRELGYDPKRTNEILGEYLSDSQKEADEAVSNADGFVDAIVKGVQNPRSIAGGIAQSAPGMLGGMGVSGAVARRVALKAALNTTEGAAVSAAELAAGRTAAQAAEAALKTGAGKEAASAALNASATKLIAVGAVTEGAQSAGNIADEAQAAGRSWDDYALPALAAGAGTAAIGVGAGKLLGDSATELATGARSAGVKGSLPARVGKEFFSEGLLEEAPQSYQEQVARNFALDEQDRTKGAAAAAGSGLLVGGVQGGALGAIQRHHPTVLKDTGVLSQAANAGQQALSDKINAALPVDAAPRENPSLPISPLVDAARGNNDALVNQLMRPENAQAQQIDDGSPQNFNQLLARNAQANQDQQEQAQIDAEFKQEQLDRLRANAPQKPTVPAPTGSFGQVNEFANLADQERKDQAQRIAEIAQKNKFAQEQNARAEQEAALAGQIADTDARVAGADQQRSMATRSGILSDVLSSQEAVGKTPSAIARLFQRELEKSGHKNTKITPVDWVAINKRHDAEAALSQAEQEYSAPNELTDAVPEKREANAADAGVNFKAVDDAIARGMALKTPNGNVLHKKGSSKIFKLNPAQREHYLKSIAATEKAKAFDEAAHQSATSPTNDIPQPTEAQKEAGNYTKGHASIHGLNVTIENPEGSTRSGVDRDGTPWETKMEHHYGYIKGTIGADKDHIDTFVGKSHASNAVFIVDQVHPDTGTFDEHKVMLGFNSLEEAKAAYQANYAQGWTGGKNATETTVEDFKNWLKEGDTTKPFAPIAKEEVKNLYRDGELLSADELLQYYLQEIKGTEKGVIIPNSRFEIGSIDENTANEIAIYIDGYTGSQRKLRVSGRTLKHVEETRPKIAQEIIENLQAYFVSPDEILPDPKHQNKRALLVHRASDSKLKNHVATIEVEIEIEVSDGFIDIVTIMTSPDRSLKEARALKENWREGQQMPFGYSPHPIATEVTHAEADLPSVPPVESSVTQENKEVKPPIGQDLRKMTVLQMTDAQLLETLEKHPNREKSVLKQMEKRGIADPRKTDDAPTEKQAEAPKPAPQGNRKLVVKSKDELRSALKSGAVADLPSGDWVRVTEDDHGWNFHYSYADNHNIWASGTMRFVPGAKVVQSKEAAIENAIEDQWDWRWDAKKKDVEPKPTKQEDAPAPPSAPLEKTKKELAAEKVNSGLAELFAKLGDGTQLKMMPEQRRSLMPILTQVFEGAVELGYESFKDAAKYVLGEMRKLGGAGFADQFNLGELKGAYNSLSPSEENEVAATKVRSIDEIDQHTFASEEVVEPEKPSKALADIHVLVKITNADTGQTSRLKSTASAALAKIDAVIAGQPKPKTSLSTLDDRIDTLEALIKCMKG